jgi:hypothetical protein
MTTIPIDLYNSVIPYYENAYGSLSNNIYELTLEKAEHYLDNYDNLIADLETRRNLFDSQGLEDIQNDAMALSEFIEEWLVKTQCLQTFSDSCDLPLELYYMVANLL